MTTPLYLGGLLIKRFDGFRRLCRRAAVDFQLPLTIPDEDMLLTNRILASLGGPPASSQVTGTFLGDGLPTLLLFLMTQEFPCNVGLMGRSEPHMARLKSLVHLLSQAVYPMISGNQPLQFQDVVKELGPSGAVLHPQFQYDEDGEPTSMELSGAAGAVHVGPEAGPYTLLVLAGEHSGPALLASPGDGMHPTVLILP
jgi:hypothetical protein